MKIVFLTNCLEPGKDGVGDYTTALAAECLQQGHQCRTVALNDPFIGEPQESNGPVPILRLGCELSWTERVHRGRRFIAEFEPDRISLQFVCYGFHPKGFVFGMGERFRELIGGTPLHLMFHELWIGAQTGAGFKERLIGSAQKFGVMQLLATLRPEVVHTSNPAYRERLARCGVKAGVLPLFGNIPIPASDADDAWLWSELKKTGIEPGNRGASWLFCLFGTLHPVWPPEPLFAALAEAARLHQRRIAIVAVGRLGTGESLWQSMVAQYSDRFGFCQLGERTAEEIGQVFRAADFGISASPWIIVGKSGTTVAMLEHGLPVVVNRDELRYPFAVADDAAQSPLLCKLGPDLANRLPELKRLPPRLRLPEIAGQFLACLKK